MQSPKARSTTFWICEQSGVNATPKPCMNSAIAMRYSQEQTTKIGMNMCEELIKITATEKLGMKLTPRQRG